MTASENNEKCKAAFKEEIKNSLNKLATGDLLVRARAFFNVLGYESQRTLELDGEPQSFINQFPSQTGGRDTKTQSYFLSKAKSVPIIFQITGEEISASNQTSFFNQTEFDEGRAQSFLFIAVALKKGTYARGKYAEMTREISKRFGMPVCV